MEPATPSASQTDVGHPAGRFTLTNANGLSVEVIATGATVTAVNLPGRDGNVANVTLKFDDLRMYERNPPYFGATIGRVGNRIAGGRFSLNGENYTLATNNGPNHLHGGVRGFDKRVWRAEPNEPANAVTFRYTSADGEEGYPSSLDVRVTYTLTQANELRIDYAATNTGDRATPINLTNHAYWNLVGARDGTILNHRLTLFADRYLPVDDALIPTGEIKSVVGTPFDFRTPRAVGERIEQAGGYDHCFVVNGKPGELRPAARLEDPATGRVMEVLTTEPGVQLYSGNFLDGSEGNGRYPKHGGLCLEPQHFPDAVNRPAFPSTILEPGKTYRSTTVHRFSVAR